MNHNLRLLTLAATIGLALSLNAQTALMSQAAAEVAEGNYTTFSQLQNTMEPRTDDPDAPYFLELIYNVADNAPDNLNRAKSISYITKIEKQLGSETANNGIRYWLACFYRKGLVVKADPHKAFDYATVVLRNAQTPALRGKAAFLLGEMAEAGQGTTRDIQSAINYYNAALACDHPQALARLEAINDNYGSQYFNPFPVLMQQYSGIGDYTDDCAAVQKFGKWGLANPRDGSEILKPKYDSIMLVNEHPTLFKAKKPQLKWTIIDRNGNEMFNSSYDDVVPVVSSLKNSDNTKWLYIVTRDDNMGMVNNSMEKIDTYTGFSHVEHFLVGDKDFFRVTRNGQVGAYNVDGVGRVPHIFKNIVPVDGSDKLLLAIKKDGTKAVYNTDGILLLPDNADKKFYDEIIPVAGHLFFIVKSDRKYGLVDLSNHDALPIAFDDMFAADNITNMVAVKQNGQWMLVSTTGVVIVHPGIIDQIGKGINGGFNIITKSGSVLELIGEFPLDPHNPRAGTAQALINNTKQPVDTRLQPAR